MTKWFEVNEIQQEDIKFVVSLTEYKGQLLIINNKKRGGWEIPGGTREAGETLLLSASRELYEETGAVRFDLEPYGVYELNGSYGMMFFAVVHELADLPDFEIDQIDFVNSLPDGLNFGDMFYKMHRKWIEYGAKNSQRYGFDLSGNLEKTFKKL
jgi:8-oxo-dGTP diphosphatase